VDVARRFTRLKHRLMPYLYGAAAEAHATGVPVMRPMLLEFPEDPACRTLDRQYMLGPDLLVAPVLTFGGEVEVYLPAGDWTHLLSGETVTGPCWRRETHALDSLPLYVRPGAVLPLGADDSRPDGDWPDGLTLLVAPGGAGTVRVTVPDHGGATAAVYEVTRTPEGPRAIVSGTELPYTVRVLGPGGV